MLRNGFGLRAVAVRGLALAVGLGVAIGAFGSASAATMVGTGLGDVSAEQRVTVAHPQPVQLLFQFKTKGAPNARATKFAKPAVLEAVKGSGLFSEVSDTPVPNGAILNVTIDNVVDPEEMKAAAAKGFATGATLGLAGSTIRDHYNGVVDYVAGPASTPISSSAKHDLVTQIGLIKTAPTDAVKVEGGMKGAVFTMVRQLVDNPLNAVAAQPGFAPAGEVTVPPGFKAPAAEMPPEPIATPVSAPATSAPPAEAAPPEATPAPQAAPAAAVS